MPTRPHALPHAPPHALPRAPQAASPSLRRRPGWLVLALVALVAAALALEARSPEALAQGNAPAPAATPTAPGTAAADAPTSLPSFDELFMFSPYINGAIAALSALALGLALFFWATINASAFAPAGFVDNVRKLVLDRQFKEAADLCRRNANLFVASVLQRCVENVDKGDAVVMSVIDVEGRRRAELIWNRVSYLADIANVAPMLGLLGTVLGMIKAFFTLDPDRISINSLLLSRSIGEAMSTTMFGLSVAILALLLHALVKARTTRTLADAEQVVHSIIDHIQDQPARKNAH